MSDVDSGAVAPAEPAGVPIEAAEPSTQPLGSQTPVAEKPPEAPKPEPEKPEAKPEDDKPSKSAGDAVRKAFEKIEKDSEAKTAEKPAEPKAEAKPTEQKPEAKPEQPRENGKFASANPKPDAPKEDAPAWLKAHEKDHWGTATPEVRAIVERRNTEAAAGVEKYKAGHEANERLRPYYDMAQQAGITIESALKEYTDLDKLLHTDKVRGMEAVLNRVGLTPHQYASFILNQSPDEQRSQSESTIRELKQQNATLEARLSKIEGGINQQNEQSTIAEITKFAEAPEHSRFEELHQDIAFFMQTGRANNLAEAYDLAERLNPAPVTAPAVKPALKADPDPEPQNLAGQKSIHGAPTTGSNPDQRKPSSNNREALKRAFARIPA